MKLPSTGLDSKVIEEVNCPLKTLDYRLLLNETLKIQRKQLKRVYYFLKELNFRYNILSYQENICQVLVRNWMITWS
jgi:hypothetical protein